MIKDQLSILERELEKEKKARIKAEEALKEKTNQLTETSQKLEVLLNNTTIQLQGVFENIIDAYVVVDVNGNILKSNDAAKNLFGYDVNKEPVSVLNLIYRADIPYARSCYQELQEKGFLKDFEVRICTKNKEVRWAYVNASVIYDDDGVGIAAQGIVRDITEHKAAAEKLVNSESRLSSLILNLDSAVLLEDENRKVVLTNRKFCDLFQMQSNPEAMEGQDCSKAAEQCKLLFEDEEGFVERIDTLLRNKKTVLSEELVMKNGTILEWDFIPINQDGVYKGHLCAYRDVTLSRNYRKSIEAERLKYSSIIANMKLGLLEVDTDDKIVMVNQSFTEISGYTKEELLGKNAGELLKADKEDDTIKAENQKRLKGQSNSYEFKAKNASGEIKYWLISGAPNYNLKGEVIGSIGFHLDITELRNLEIQKEKLLDKLEKSNEELQEYAHIVSHDLKSPLRSINALVNWVKEDNKDKLDTASFQNLDHIENILEQMEQLISDILDYSSIGNENKRLNKVDTQTLVEELIDMLFIPEHVNISILNKLPTLRGDKTKIQQIFQNLIGNAIKFIDKPKGEIVIDVQSKNSHWEFSINDNGVGIADKFHNSIFKIFHSLNKSKESTGIGLSIVKKIVELHGGQIWLESKLNAGTTFYFTLKK